jgi:hypothetical protein
MFSVSVRRKKSFLFEDSDFMSWSEVFVTKTIPSSLAYGSTNRFTNTRRMTRSRLLSMTTFITETELISPSFLLKNSKDLIESREFVSIQFTSTEQFSSSHSRITESKFMTITGRLSNTEVFIGSSLISASFGRSHSTSESVSLSRTFITEGGEVVSSAPNAEVRVPSESISTLGHVFSCALLIIVGMAFWIRSAYMENALTTLKLEDLEDSES